MLKTVFRFLARIAILVGLVYLARGALKRWIEGPEPSPAAEPPTPASEAVAPPPPPPPAAVAAEAKVEAADRKAATRRSAQKAAGGSSGEWVPPDEDGTAPSTHPVKVKLGSKVYREPGSSGYDRCRPDRCYASVAAAEADGFVRAKR